VVLSWRALFDCDAEPEHDEEFIRRHQEFQAKAEEWARAHPGQRYAGESEE
jgi:hypothetical protein